MRDRMTTQKGQGQVVQDEGILVNTWSALGRRMAARQTGQQCCDESVDSGNGQFISPQEQGSIKPWPKKRKPFLQQPDA